ncbi:hypothetical protein CAPTEDRAFT_206213 [Capitella teleta]|uniref:Uncharacterized protein n=1 Tax=Capitella teleta TaxID=283909 RepID=R7TYY3_CAPTE|nr:hypothetical protein CAPTEDRAFT_206213 [Capitella teleta]|eukprot:ELT96165.1 hypothetical protein CAPTEDRAFT_206213 [Capitella teleta]
MMVLAHIVFFLEHKLTSGGLKHKDLSDNMSIFIMQSAECGASLPVDAKRSGLPSGECCLTAKQGRALCTTVYGGMQDKEPLGFALLRGDHPSSLKNSLGGVSRHEHGAKIVRHRGEWALEFYSPYLLSSRHGEGNIRLTWREYLISALSWSPAGDCLSPSKKKALVDLYNEGMTIDDSERLQLAAEKSGMSIGWITVDSISRFATDQEPVKSRRESERRPTQEMTAGDLKRAGRLCNKAQQLSSFESEQEHGKRQCIALVYLKNYDTDGSGSLPQELKVDMQVPSAHSAKKGKRFLEEDASFHRPAPVLSEDED